MRIAIDGPAGAGKSTVAREIAAKLDIRYLDTGAMYRALACWLEDEGISPRDADRVKAALPGVRMRISFEEGAEHVFINDRDITPEIRTERASIGASDVAVIPEVRLRLVELQRQTASENDVVVDGRDIGSYVLPDAEYKFYLTASVDARTQRRCGDLKAAGLPCDPESVKREIEERDRQDMNREFAPLKRTEDQILIDTTDLTLEQATARILEAVGKGHDL